MTRPRVAAESLVALGATERRLDEYENYEIALGALRISRALPVRGRRMIGPWCFLDRFGPLSFTEGMPMDVAPHPHMGLQTVTWLLEGEVVHDDSLGEEAVLRPGGVNVMTSGHAIAHAERTPTDNTGRLNGVQLWTALPDRDRHGAPSFQHVKLAPVLELSGGIVRVFPVSSATPYRPHITFPIWPEPICRCIEASASRYRYGPTSNMPCSSSPVIAHSMGSRSESAFSTTWARNAPTHPSQVTAVRVCC
jgi:hypothetical protein